jgi:hypothetical protein
MGSAFSPLVARLYADLLHRTPSDAESAYWTDVLASGASPAQVAGLFTGSAEYRANLVRQDYLDFLGREPEPAALGYWVNQLASGVTEQGLAAKLLGSDEFFRQQASVARHWSVAPKAGTKQAPHFQLDPVRDWLTGVYGVVLGRMPDAAGLAYWEGRLGHGTPRESVAFGLLTSAEAETWVVTDSYNDLLGRPPDGPGVAWWVSALGHGLTPSGLVAELAGSAEYSFNLSQPPGPGPVPVSVTAATLLPTTDPGFGTVPVDVLTVTGTATAGTSVIVAIDGVPQLRSRVGPGGTWVVSLPAALPFGTHQAAGRPINVISPSPVGFGGGPISGGPVAFQVGSTNPAQPPVPAGKIANVNISQTTQTNVAEESIAVDPTNPQRLFAAGIAVDLPAGQVVGFSTDGGATWTSRLAASGSDNLTAGHSDPALAWDNSGNLFWAYINDSAGVGGNGSSIILNLSTDGGKTFTELTQFPASPGGNGADQPKLAVGANTVWVMFTDQGPTPSVIRAAGAQVTGLGKVGTFSALETVPGSDGGNFGSIAIGPSGQVMVNFETNTSSGGGGPENIMFSLDPDGLGPAGFSQAAIVNATNVGGNFSVPPQPGPFGTGGRTIDAESKLAWDRSGGPHNGRVYIEWTDALQPGSADATGIFVRHSDDDGATWSTPDVQAFDTAGMAQFLPSIDVDQTDGSVGLSWYDCRNDTGSGPDDRDNKPDTDAEIYATASFDGGQTFIPNIKVASGPSNSVTLNPDSMFNFGDYTGLAYTAGTMHPVWADNSTTLPGGHSPLFSMATAAVVLVPQGGGGGGGGGGGPALPEDQFEPNDTSDKAFNFGLLAAGSQAFKGLTITKHANGQPDYDWFRWTAGSAGTFGASVAGSNGNLEVHLFTLSGNTLVELAKDTTAGQKSKAVMAAVTAGETLLVEVKGIELSVGVFGQATYDLTVNLG